MNYCKLTQCFVLLVDRGQTTGVCGHTAIKNLVHNQRPGATVSRHGVSRVYTYTTGGMYPTELIAQTVNK